MPPFHDPVKRQVVSYPLYRSQITIVEAGLSVSGPVRWGWVGVLLIVTCAEGLLCQQGGSLPLARSGQVLEASGGMESFADHLEGSDAKGQRRSWMVSLGFVERRF